ncbi:MAG: hypothetical protein ACO294_11660 [Methylococcales bacterium]
MDKREDWMSSLSPQIRKHLKSQPLWHGHDLVKVTIIGLVIGYLIRWGQSI